LSVRKLAEIFDVSTRIVVDAFDVLESEHLITREPGRGVFASKRNLKATLDVCLFAYQVRPQRDLYFANLVRMTQPPFLHEGFSFNIRMVPENSNVTYQHFLQELTKIDKYMDVDCLLMNVPFLTKQQINACIKLNTPVIFIGDFSVGLYPELPYNQIAGDNVWFGQETIRQVAELEQCNELTVYLGSMDYYFNRRFYDGAINEAKKIGIEIHLIEFPKDISNSSSEFEKRTIYQEVKATIDKGWHKYPAIINDERSGELLLNAFNHYGIDVTIYNSKKCKKSFEPFFETIYQRIETVVKNPECYKKIRLKSKINVERMPME
jgi:hypothetical protein